MRRRVHDRQLDQVASPTLSHRPCRYAKAPVAGLRWRGRGRGREAVSATFTVYVDSGGSRREFLSHAGSRAQVVPGKA